MDTTHPQVLCGGMGNVRPADDEVQSLLNQCKPMIEKHIGKDLDELKAVSYATQVVAGLNYFIKAATGNGHYIHVRIYRHFSGTNQVSSVLTGLNESEPLKYF